MGERKEKDGKNRWKREKAASEQQGQTKSKCQRKIMYLDTMHHRLQSVMINLFRLLLYHCFINILQLPSARTSYRYNSLSKTLLRKCYVVPLFMGTLILPGVFTFFSFQHHSSCLLSCLHFVCLVLNVPHHHLTQQPFVQGWKSWYGKNPSPLVAGQ